MMHPTIEEFNKTIEIMRKVYPFKDESTRIVKMHDLYTNSNNCITLMTRDEETGVDIELERKIEVENGEQY